MQTIFLTLLLTLPRTMPDEKPFVITHVNIIDCVGTEPLTDHSVIISGNRITRIGPSKDVPVPPNATVVDGQGKYLIPGLWDMHIHWYGKEQIPLFIANGVTGVRFMFGHPMALSWRKEIEENKLIGPRMVIGGRIVDGPKPVWPGSIAVSTIDEAKKSVEITRQEGYDFVKVYSQLSRDTYFALAEEARKQRMVFAGHVPWSVTAAEASDSGLKSFEHLYGILQGCSSKEEELARAFSEARKDIFNPDAALLQRTTEQMLDSYDSQKANALFIKFKKNDTWQVPTLTVLRSLAYLDNEKFTNDARSKYMPASILSSWNPKTDFRLKNFKPETYARRKLVLKHEMKVVKTMHDAGVGILAGTDALNPYCYPGFSLHDELALLVECGLTPRDALLTATRHPARFLNQEKDLGSLEPGKLADAVLLDANPLADIRNTRKIAGVVKNGRWFDSLAIQTLLDDAEKVAQKK